MKKILQLLLLASLLQACKNNKSDGFTVKGTLTDTTFSILYLEEVRTTDNQPFVVDSTQPDKNGRFTLNAPATDDHVYYLRSDKQGYPLCLLINDTKSIELDIRFEQLQGRTIPAYTVNGSPASAKVRNYTNDLNKWMMGYVSDLIAADTLSKKSGATAVVDSLQQLISRQSKELLSRTDSTLNAAITPSTYLLLLGFYQSIASDPSYRLTAFTLEEIAANLDKLAVKFPKHVGLTQIREQIKADMVKSKGLMGQTAPEFTLPDVNGKAISLNSFRGKWVLVDFWASWCRPCRMENPNVVAAYQQFKNKNFTVLGVSLDREDGKEDWIKAIKDDRLEWTQVSELKFWNSIVVPMYNIEGIPYNVLVDPQGKIVAENLRGPDLAKKLQAVLK
jgi:thiol-disulfide isomerase/thioredoxin